MRLWSLHPRYQDTRGLVAAWREALLAQKVLNGTTRGYRNHPQLERFRAHPAPPSAIARYLHAVCDEGHLRGYRLDRGKIGAASPDASSIEVTEGQLRYEFSRLKRKLQTRDSAAFERLSVVDQPERHPSFIVVPGPIASWERPDEELLTA